jgi:hypothetical protein
MGECTPLTTFEYQSGSLGNGNGLHYVVLTNTQTPSTSLHGQAPVTFDYAAVLQYVNTSVESSTTTVMTTINTSPTA